MRFRNSWHLQQATRHPGCSGTSRFSVQQTPAQLSAVSVRENFWNAPQLMSSGGGVNPVVPGVGQSKTILTDNYSSAAPQQLIKFNLNCQYET